MSKNVVAQASAGPGDGTTFLSTKSFWWRLFQMTAQVENDSLCSQQTKYRNDSILTTFFTHTINIFYLPLIIAINKIIKI